MFISIKPPFFWYPLLTKKYFKFTSWICVGLFNYAEKSYCIFYIGYKKYFYVFIQYLDYSFTGQQCFFLKNIYFLFKDFSLFTFYRMAFKYESLPFLVNCKTLKYFIQIKLFELFYVYVQKFFFLQRIKKKKLLVISILNQFKKKFLISQYLKKIICFTGVVTDKKKKNFIKNFFFFWKKKFKKKSILFIILKKKIFKKTKLLFFKKLLFLYWINFCVFYFCKKFYYGCCRHKISIRYPLLRRLWKIYSRPKFKRKFKHPKQLFFRKVNDYRF